MRALPRHGRVPQGSALGSLTDEHEVGSKSTGVRRFRGVDEILVPLARRQTRDATNKESLRMHVPARAPCSASGPRREATKIHAITNHRGSLEPTAAAQPLGEVVRHAHDGVGPARSTASKPSRSPRVVRGQIVISGNQARTPRHRTQCPRRVDQRRIVVSMDGIRFDLVQRAPQPRRIPQIQAAPSPKPSHRDSAWIEIANTAHSVRVQQPELVFVPGVQGVRSELERHAFLPAATSECRR